MIEAAATRVNPDAGDEAPAGGTDKRPRITALLRQAVKALTLRSAAPAPPKKSGSKGDDEKGRGGLLRPFRAAARRTTEDLWRIARRGFRQAMPMFRHQHFVRQATATSFAEDCWFHQWQNAAAPAIDDSADYGAANHSPPLDL